MSMCTHGNKLAADVALCRTSHGREHAAQRPGRYPYCLAGPWWLERSGTLNTVCVKAVGYGMQASDVPALATRPAGWRGVGKSP